MGYVLLVCMVLSAVGVVLSVASMRQSRREFTAQRRLTAQTNDIMLNEVDSLRRELDEQGSAREWQYRTLRNFATETAQWVIPEQRLQATGLKAFPESN